MPLSRINNPFLSSSGAGNASITSPAANTLAFTTSTTERMKLDSSGLVGIGTSSPTSLLHVSSTTANPQIKIADLSVAGGRGGSIYGSYGGNGLYLDSLGASGWVYIGLGPTGGQATTLRFDTSNTERMRIDSLGRSTLTSQPFFYAIKNTAQTGYNASSSGDVVVIYDTATTNTGSHYNTSTGKFTAPVAGNYIFYASAYSAATTFNQSWLVVNGSRGSYGTDWMNPTASNMAHGFWLIKLAANDTVGYHPYNGSASSVTIATNPEHVHFRGYLLS